MGSKDSWVMCQQDYFSYIKPLYVGLICQFNVVGLFIFDLMSAIVDEVYE